MARDAGAEDEQDLFGAMDDEVEIGVDEMEGYLTQFFQQIQAATDPQQLLDFLREEMNRVIRRTSLSRENNMCLEQGKGFEHVEVTVIGTTRFLVT